MIPEGYGLMKPMSNRLPVGPGSRGGRFHEPAYRAEYYRAWRAANPAYRERERRRSLSRKAFARLARVLSGGPYARPSS